MTTKRKLTAANAQALLDTLHHALQNCTGWSYHNPVNEDHGVVLQFCNRKDTDAVYFALNQIKSGGYNAPLDHREEEDHAKS